MSSADSTSVALSIEFKEISTFRLPDPTQKVVELLGQGSFGKVYKVLDVYGVEYAVKVNGNIKEQEKEENEHEASILCAIRKTGKTEFLLRSFREYSAGSRFLFQMELLDMNLFDYLRNREDQAPLPMSDIVNVFEQILQATVDLFDIGYVHGDIKLENILLCKHSSNELKVKLADYGLSTSVRSVCFHRGGTKRNMAPELVLHLGVTERIDTWAIGCVLFYLFCNYDLFNANDSLRAMGQMVDIFGVQDVWMTADNFNDYCFKNKRDHFKVHLPTNEDAVEKNYVINGEKRTLDQLLRKTALEHPLTPESLEIRSFIHHLLHPVPSERMTPKEVLEYWNFCLVNYCN